MRLNTKNVSALTVPEGKSEILVWDDDLSGFGLRMLASGTKTWFVQYRTAAGQRRTRIGRFPLISPDKAREEAKAILAPVMLGRDPGAEKIKAKHRAKVTLGSVADDYLVEAEKKLRPRSYEEVERHLKRHWNPLRPLPIDDVTRRDVAARLNEIADTSGPFAANRCRSSLSAMFTWAMTQGLTERNPVVGTAKAIEEADRDHVLTPQELAAVWCAGKDDDYGRILRLLILTAARREEVGGMSWSEIDLDRGTWTIPGSRAKNHEEHIVPLSAEAMEIIKSTPRVAGRDPLFGYGEGGFSGWSKSKQRLDERLREEGVSVREWRLHDLRRTASTLMGDHLGIPPHVIETILNHRGGFRSGVSGVYNRSQYMKERRQALDMWGSFVSDLVSGRIDKILPLRVEAMQ